MEATEIPATDATTTTFHELEFVLVVTRKHSMATTWKKC